MHLSNSKSQQNLLNNVPSHVIALDHDGKINRLPLQWSTDWMAPYLSVVEPLGLINY
jgi:hypothetical protein